MKFLLNLSYSSQTCLFECSPVIITRSRTTRSIPIFEQQQCSGKLRVFNFQSLAPPGDPLPWGNIYPLTPVFHGHDRIRRTYRQNWWCLRFQQWTGGMCRLRLPRDVFHSQRIQPMASNDSLVRDLQMYYDQHTARWLARGPRPTARVMRVFKVCLSTGTWK